MTEERVLWGVGCASGLDDERWHVIASRFGEDQAKTLCGRSMDFVGKGMEWDRAPSATSCHDCLVKLEARA